MFKRMSSLIILSILASQAAYGVSPYFKHAEQAIIASDFNACRETLSNYSFNNNELKRLKSLSHQVAHDRYHRAYCPALVTEDKSTIAKGAILGTVGLGAATAGIAAGVVAGTMKVLLGASLFLPILPIAIGAPIVAGLGYKTIKTIKSGYNKRASKSKYHEACQVDRFIQSLA